MVEGSIESLIQGRVRSRDRGGAGSMTWEEETGEARKKKRDGWVPIHEDFSDLGGPCKGAPLRPYG